MNNQAFESIDDFIYGIHTTARTLVGGEETMDESNKRGLLIAIRQLSCSARNEISLPAISDIATSKRVNRIDGCLDGINIVANMLEQLEIVRPDWWTDAKKKGLVSVINELSYSASIESLSIRESIE